MEDIRDSWLVIINGEEMYVSEKLVKIWGGNKIPKKDEIIPIQVEKGKEASKVSEIDIKEKKIWLKGVKFEEVKG